MTLLKILASFFRISLDRETYINLPYELNLSLLHHIEVGEYDQVFLCYKDSSRVRLNTRGNLPVFPVLPVNFVNKVNIIYNSREFLSHISCLEDWERLKKEKE